MYVPMMNIRRFLIMYRDKTFLAIIPARGGSKRLPKKNILNLAGKPLIAWTIEAALQSRYLDTVVVTSDDDDILTVSAQPGINILKRPDSLATDTASTFDVLEHVVKHSNVHDYIVLLQPTSPLRNATHIDQAIELLERKKADAIISVTKMEHSPQWSNTLPEDGNMSHFIDESVKNKRSQDLEPHYRLNGAIYICKTTTLLNEKTFFIQANIFAYKMDSRSSIDIDTPEDFEFANFLTQHQQFKDEQI